MRSTDDAVLRRVSTLVEDKPDQEPPLVVSWDELPDEASVTHARRWWYLTDSQFSVVAMIDPLLPHLIEERVGYEPYGRGEGGWHGPGDMNGEGVTDSIDLFAYLDANSLQLNTSQGGPGSADAHGDSSAVAPMRNQVLTV